jgi:hypothetical protein
MDLRVGKWGSDATWPLGSVGRADSKPGNFSYAAANESVTALGCGRHRLHADAAIEVSYREATGMNPMTGTVTIDRPSVTKPVSRQRSRKPLTVTASALALHLDCSRTYIAELEADGVIQRQGDGLPARPEPRCLDAIIAT